VIVAAVLNSDLLAEIYANLDDGTVGWICAFADDPSKGDWSGRIYANKPSQAQVINAAATTQNTYFCVAALKASGAQISRKKICFERLCVLLADDADPNEITNCSWAIETSPGSFQVGILLDADDPDTRDLDLIDALMSAMAARNLVQVDKSGNTATRYGRLCGGLNTKPRPSGHWAVRMHTYAPSVRWTLEDAAASFGIDLTPLRGAVKQVAERKASGEVVKKESTAGQALMGLLAPLPERGYHSNLISIASHYVASGMFPGAVRNALQNLLLTVKEKTPPHLWNSYQSNRWQERFDDIDRIVDSAVEKFTPVERKRSDITITLKNALVEPERPDMVLPFMDWLELSQHDPQPAQWVVEGWLPRGTVTLLSANGGVGKSNLALQLAFDVHKGNAFFGMPTQPCKVLIVSGEDQAQTVHYRMANICQANGVALHTLRNEIIVFDMTQVDCVLWRDGAPTERLGWLGREVLKHKPGLVIIDNASDVYADNENERAMVRGFMRALNLIGQTGMCAILLLAHVDKASVRVGAGMDSNTMFSGSTAWNNSARSRWAMYKDDAMVVLRHEKSNFGMLQTPIELEFNAAGHVFVPFGTTPGSAFAAKMVRKSQQHDILQMIESANQSNINMSMQVSARNNVYRQLSDDPAFPARLERRTFFSMLRELKDLGYLREESYRLSNRSQGQRVVLTDAGRAHLAGGSV